MQFLEFMIRLLYLSVLFFVAIYKQYEVILLPELVQENWKKSFQMLW